MGATKILNIYELWGIWDIHGIGVNLMSVPFHCAPFSSLELSGGADRQIYLLIYF